MLVVAGVRSSRPRPRDIVYVAPGGYNIATASINVKFSGRITNIGNATLTATVKLLAKSTGGALASPGVSQSVTVSPDTFVDVTLSQIARDTDPAGTLTASAWLEQNGVVVSGSQVNSNALATISTPPALDLTGGFAFERQVRYVGGVDTPTPRQAFMILTAYSESSGVLTKLREVRSGDFQIPTSFVPNIIVPVYSTDPPGWLAGGIKMYDAVSSGLMPSTYGNERIGTRLWGLNMGAVTAVVTGTFQNYYAQVTYRLTVTLKNTGDADMTVRWRSWVEARQSGTDVNFGEIPGFVRGWYNITIPKGGSVQIAPSAGPAYAPDPYYGYIAYGNYVRLYLSIEAVSAGVVPSLMAWNAGYTQSVTI
ncbi:MAG: hypothetical protein Q8P23_00775 [bacterium]|nr:hypothetical protein [bacterium]